MTNKIIFLGDSQFLVKNNLINNEPRNLIMTLSELLNEFNVCIYNYSNYGDTLFTFHDRYIRKGPLPLKKIDYIFIGFGTNDSNYYYSLNSFIETPNLHRELLINLIEILFKNLSPKKIILCPTPPVKIKDDNKRESLINNNIYLFNMIRKELSLKYSYIEYINNLLPNKNLHLDNDGLHLNDKGILYSAFIINEYIKQLLGIS